MSSGLEFRATSRSFGSHEVLHDVSLTVHPAECVALLGASGSGKSTLLRLAAGLDEPTAGQILIDGDDVRGVPAERRGTALVFQKPLLFPHLTVIDNVAFAARMAGRKRTAARREAMEYLDVVQLADLARRSVGQLSGGQEQRVALARALARHPRILLLDEPFGSLDMPLREDMYALMEAIRSELAPTVVLVTHDRREASILADSVAVLDAGSILQHGTVHEVHYQPATRAANRLLGGLNEIHGHVIDGVHHSRFAAVPVQDRAPEGPSFLVVRQEALQLIPQGGGPALAKLEVAGTSSLGAHTLVRLVVGSGDAAQTLTVEEPGGSTLLPGQVVGVGLRHDRAWAVPS